MKKKMKMMNTSFEDENAFKIFVKNVCRLTFVERPVYFFSQLVIIAPPHTADPRLVHSGDDGALNAEPSVLRVPVRLQEKRSSDYVNHKMCLFVCISYPQHYIQFFLSECIDLGFPTIPANNLWTFRRKICDLDRVSATFANIWKNNQHDLPNFAKISAY